MNNLPVSELEQVYDALALAIDRVPEGQVELFLVKLALLLAGELGDRPRFETLLETALDDLS